MLFNKIMDNINNNVCIFSELLGYDTASLLLTLDSNKTLDTKPEPKKPRTSYDPSNSDWDYLIASKRHKDVSNAFCKVLGLKAKLLIDNQQADSTMEAAQGIQINTEAPLFTSLPIILFSLHLMYEELKLHSTYESHLKPLAKLLSRISHDLRLCKYIEHYWKDFPDCCDIIHKFHESQITEACLKKLTFPNYVTEVPVQIFKQIYDILTSNKVSAFPYISGVNKISKTLVQVGSVT